MYCTEQIPYRNKPPSNTGLDLLPLPQYGSHPFITVSHRAYCVTYIVCFVGYYTCPVLCKARLCQHHCVRCLTYNIRPWLFLTRYKSRTTPNSTSMMIVQAAPDWATIVVSAVVQSCAARTIVLEVRLGLYVTRNMLRATMDGRCILSRSWVE